MPMEMKTEEVRQSEGNRNTFWVLVVSTCVAVVLAIAAYAYVSATDDDALAVEDPASIETGS